MIFHRLPCVSALSLIVAAAFSATTASAQDYSRFQPQTDWTGFYAGIHGGIAPTKTPNIFSEGAWLGGLQAGYLSQFGSVVVGGELEGSYSGGQRHKTGGGGELNQYWTGAAKLKAGVALDGTLLYGTAGYGFAQLEPGKNVTSKSEWRGGMLFGAGVEQNLGNGLSVKLEYDQLRLNDVKTVVGGGKGYSDSLVNHTVKAGLNMRF